MNFGNNGAFAGGAIFGGAVSGGSMASGGIFGAPKPQMPSGSWASTGNVGTVMYTDDENLFYSKRALNNTYGVPVSEVRDAYSLFTPQRDATGSDLDFINDSIKLIPIIKDIYYSEAVVKILNSRVPSKEESELLIKHYTDIKPLIKISYMYSLLDKIENVIRMLGVYYSAKIESNVVQTAYYDVIHTASILMSIYYPDEFLSGSEAIYERVQRDFMHIDSDYADVTKVYREIMLDEKEAPIRRVSAIQFINSYVIFGMGVTPEKTIIAQRCTLTTLPFETICVSTPTKGHPDTDRKPYGMAYVDMPEQSYSVSVSSFMAINDVMAGYQLTLIYNAIKYHFGYEVSKDELDGTYRGMNLATLSNILREFANESHPMNPVGLNKVRMEPMGNLSKLQHIIVQMNCAPSIAVIVDGRNQLINPLKSVTKTSFTDSNFITNTDLSMTTFKLSEDTVKYNQGATIISFIVDHFALKDDCFRVTVDGDELKFEMMNSDYPVPLRIFKTKISKYQSVEHAILEANPEFDSVSELAESVFGNL